jgi:hypothetical protein
MMPEESSGAAEVMMIGDVRVEGAASKMGIPNPSDYAEYGQARVKDLWSSLTEETGPHARGSAIVAYAVFETKVILARYKVLAGVEHYLMSVRSPPLPYGIVWRYLCILVSNLWLNKEINLVAFDRDVVNYALSAPINDLAIRSAPEALMMLVSTSIDQDWLREATMLHEAEVAKKGGGGRDIGGGHGGGGDAGTGLKKCVACGKVETGCGGYKSPDFKCKNPVSKACKYCGNLHLDRGDRGWKCRHARTAAKLLSASEKQAAFAVGFSAFRNGNSSIPAAAVKKVIDQLEADDNL